MNEKSVFLVMCSLISGLLFIWALVCFAEYSDLKANAAGQNYHIECIGGVGYYVFTDSATVAYEPSGKVMKCRK